jgi:hypothetical protein
LWFRVARQIDAPPGECVGDSGACSAGDDIAAVQRSDGAGLVRQKIAALSDGERRLLREPLAETPA